MTDMSSDDIAEMVREAVARVEAEMADDDTTDMADDDTTGMADDEDVGGVDDGGVVPPRTQPADYTKFVVADAISRYEMLGLDETATHYNNPDNVDGQWYVFIIDEAGNVISHYEPSRIGYNLDGFIGTDVTGYKFGTEMQSATEDGKWVTYVYRNPEMTDPQTGDFGDSELKNAWVVRHDGLLFASGWYVSVEDFIQSLVTEMLETFDPATGSVDDISQLIGPGAIASGLSSTFEYYNNADGRGQSLVFVADSDGQIVSAVLNPELEAANITDVLGPAVLAALPEGTWLTEADNEPGVGPSEMRVWVVRKDDLFFGAGWRSTTN